MSFLFSFSSTPKIEASLDTSIETINKNFAVIKFNSTSSAVSETGPWKTVDELVKDQIKALKENMLGFENKFDLYRTNKLEIPEQTQIKIATNIKNLSTNLASTLVSLSKSKYLLDKENYIKELEPIKKILDFSATAAQPYQPPTLPPQDSKKNQK